MSVSKERTMPNIQRVLAVASGKGGVGKSTVALALALGLQKQGARVGLLDADIYGPSQPTLLKIASKPRIENQRIFPMEKWGLKTMSMGYLTRAQEAVVWRGPMLGSALQQLFFDTEWGELDYLVIDLPPGTGDVPLTMVQKLPISAVLMVTTPSALALMDARKAANMFVRLGVPLLGVIENLSTHTCSHCGHTDFLFGEGAGMALASEFNIPLRAHIPWCASIQEKTKSDTEDEAAFLNLIPETALHDIQEAIQRIVIPETSIRGIPS